MIKWGVILINYKCTSLKNTHCGSYEQGKVSRGFAKNLQEILIKNSSYKFSVKYNIYFIKKKILINIKKI